MRQAVVTCAVLAAVTVFAFPCQAQSPNDPDEARIEDVITASHILTNEGILDSFGHVSARSAKNPDHFFMPRAMPPALVSRADIVEVGLDCKPVDPDAPRLNASATSIARCTRRAATFNPSSILMISPSFLSA
jgi:hypothetical protein